MAAVGHLLFGVAVKGRTFLQLRVLPTMGEDGGDCEREAGGNGLENDDHFQVRTRLARQLDRQPKCSGALREGSIAAMIRLSILIVLRCHS